MTNIQTDWHNILSKEIQKPYYKNLMAFLKKEYQTQNIFPPKEKIYSALDHTSFEDTKVVILGQDPYPTRGFANGLAFSVNRGIRIPGSLRNIYKEIHDELGLDIPTTGDLTGWAKQGVLLLNTVLTVREGDPGSHRNRGWEILTDQIIKLLNTKDHPIIYLLWGNDARSKKSLIDTDKHYILESYHPSPLSARRGFFGNGHFKKCNQILEKLEMEPINWNIK